ncbi:MAG: hypothetical protein AABZ30_09305 [Myxococcota bacterium]
MSSLRLATGEDHPEAARKHADDAAALQGAGRADGAAYLAGYVVECALKTLILAEKGVSPTLPWKKGRAGHDLTGLLGQATTLASFAGAKTARYLGPSAKALDSSAIAGWDPEMRYRAPTLTAADAATWLADARSVYQETVGQMILDGVL